MTRATRRLLWLSAFWVPYFAIPFGTGWSFADNVECRICASDVLRYSFSMFGYGVIGCTFYAMTGENRSAEAKWERITAALALNVFVLLFSSATVGEWRLMIQLW